MAGPSTNLKTVVTADTSQFSAGMKRVKSDMKDLGTVSSGALSALGDAIGIDVGRIQTFTGAISGLGRKFDQLGSTGSSAFSSIAQSITPVAAGIAGLGITAAIAAFKQLNAEADAFEATIQGGAIAKQTDAYVSTFRQAIRDQQNAGQAFSTFRQNWRYAMSTIAGAFQSGFDFDIMSEAEKKAERAKEIAGELYNIELKRQENSVEVSRLEAEIAQKRDIVIDRTKSAAERSQALAEAQQLIKDKLALQLPLATQMRDLLVEYNGLASTTQKDYAAEIAAKREVNDLIEEEAAQQRRLISQQGTLNNEVRKEADARRAVAALSQKAWEARVDNTMFLSMDATSNTGSLQLPSSITSMKTPGLAPVKLQVSNWDGFFKDVDDGFLKKYGDGITIGVAFDYQEGLVDFTQAVNNAITNLADTTGTVIGNLIGDLATGGNAWQNFSNAAIGAFGDMAISVGKIAIETGVAALGIKAALESLGPEGAVAAIAAGTALVALGAAVKTGLSNIASGNYGASSVAVASSGYSSNNNFETREINLKVSGVLTGDGSTLLGVISSTENINKHTT